MVTFGYRGGSPWKAPTQFIEIDGQDATPRATLEHVPGVGLRLHMAARPASARALAPAPHDWIGGGSLSIDLSGGASNGLTDAIGPRQDQGGSPAGDTAMSVEDLATCNLSAADEYAQQMVQYNMIWSMEQTWIDEFFPGYQSTPGRPNLSSQPSRMNAIDPDCEWYNTRLAPAYLGIGISDSNGSNVTLSDDQILKLKYYLNVGIGLEFAYNRQTQAVALQAAEMSSAKLGSYANDTSGTDWAAELYNYLIAQDQLNSLLTQIQTSTEAGMAQLDDYSTILTVLDPTGKYAQQYYTAVVSGLTMLISLDSNPWLDPDLPAWLPDYIQGFIASYYTGQTRPTDPGGQAVYDIAEDFSSFVSAAGGTVAFAESFVAVTKIKPSPDMALEAEQAITWLKARYPNWTGAGSSIMSICLIGGLYSSIKAILDWPSLNAEEQANTVVSLGQIMYSTIRSMPEIASAAAWTTTSFGALVGQAYLATQNVADMASAIEQLNATWFMQGVIWLTAKFNAASKAIETLGTQIGKLFPTAASTIVKVLGPVFAAAAFGISIWGLVSDIQSGASTWNVAFDMVQTCLAGVVMAMAMAALIPGVDIVTTIIGIVAALIGAVLGFLQYLLNWLLQDEPPVDDYMNNVVIPFIDTLQVPPPGWTPLITNPA